MFLDYYFLRDYIPLIIYIFFILFRDIENIIIDKFVDLSVLLIKILLLYVIIGFVIGISLEELIPFKWNYEGIINWCVVFLVSYCKVVKSNYNKLYRFVLSMLIVVSGGWLYEICFFHPVKMFYKRNLLIGVNTQLLCLLLYIYELKRIGIKLNRLIKGLSIFFVLFSLVLYYDFYGLTYFFRWDLGVRLRWFYRIPASVLLLSLFNVELKRKEI